MFGRNKRKPKETEVNIKEQIECLRGLGFPDYDECADTMERLLAVYEAADLFLYCARTYGTQSQEGINSGNQLSDAMDAVKSNAD